MKRQPASIISLIATLATLVIGILVVFGWFTHNDFLRSIVPGAVKMKFNVALGFIFSSVVLLLFLFPQKNKIWRSVSIFLSVTVFLIGALTLVEYIFHINIGIDELFSRDELRTTATYYAGRMSPIAAGNFVLIGIGLLLLGKESSVVFQFYYLSAIALVALLMLICFNFISDIPMFIRLAIHVAFGFITLPAAIYFAQPIIRQKIKFQTKLITGFVAAIALLVVISVFSSHYNDLRLYTSYRVENTNKVLDEMNQTLSFVKDIEGGGRAYVITGDSAYLEYFTVAKRGIPVHINNLKKLTAGDAVQQKNTDSIQSLAGKRIAFSEEAIRLKNTQGLNAAINWISTPQGKYYTQRIRFFADEIQKK